MNKTEIILLSMISGCLFLLGFIMGRGSMQSEAIKKGFAEYNQNTGKWQWKEKKEVD